MIYFLCMIVSLFIVTDAMVTGKIRYIGTKADYKKNPILFVSLLFFPIFCLILSLLVLLNVIDA